MFANAMARLVGASAIALAAAAAPLAPATARPPTSDDAALGGVELALPVTLPADGKFRTVLTIKNVKFGPGEDARALLAGVLSITNQSAGKSSLVKLRMTVNGSPEERAFSETIGPQSYASGPIRCSALPVAGKSYSFALQLAGVGGGPHLVEAGTFDIIALRAIANPPL